jgi:hypothetical protein
MEPDPNSLSGSADESVSLTGFFYSAVNYMFKGPQVIQHSSWVPDPVSIATGDTMGGGQRGNGRSRKAGSKPKPPAKDTPSASHRTEDAEEETERSAGDIEMVDTVIEQFGHDDDNYTYIEDEAPRGVREVELRNNHQQRSSQSQPCGPELPPSLRTQERLPVSVPEDRQRETVHHSRSYHGPERPPRVEDLRDDRRPHTPRGTSPAKDPERAPAYSSTHVDSVVTTNGAGSRRPKSVYGTSSETTRNLEEDALTVRPGDRGSSQRSKQEVLGSSRPNDGRNRGTQQSQDPFDDGRDRHRTRTHNHPASGYDINAVWANMERYRSEREDARDQVELLERELAQVKEQFHSLQKAQLSTVDRFSPRVDSDIIECFHLAENKIKGLSNFLARYMKTSISDKAWVEKMIKHSWADAYSHDAVKMNGRDVDVRRQIWRLVVWNWLDDAMIREPFQAFGGTVAQQLHDSYGGIFGKSPGKSSERTDKRYIDAKQWMKTRPNGEAFPLPTLSLLEPVNSMATAKKMPGLR